LQDSTRKSKHWQVCAIDWQVPYSFISQVCSYKQTNTYENKKCNYSSSLRTAFLDASRTERQAGNMVRHLRPNSRKCLQQPVECALIQAGSNLIALEPTTGAVLWKSQFASSLSKIEPIEGTPFSLVGESISSETLLLNLSDGKTINISKLIKGKIDSYYVIPESYDLVFYSKNQTFSLL